MLSIVPVEAGRALMPVDGGGCNYIYTDEAGEWQQTYYRIFINVVRQPAFRSSDFPFPSLATATVISPAQLKFQSVENARAQIDQGNSYIVRLTPHYYYLQVPGIIINDHFRMVNSFTALRVIFISWQCPILPGSNPITLVWIFVKRLVILLSRHCLQKKPNNISQVKGILFTPAISQIVLNIRLSIIESEVIILFNIELATVAGMQLPALHSINTLLGKM